MAEEKKRDFDPASMVPKDDKEVERSLQLISDGMGAVALYGLYLCYRIEEMSVAEAYSKVLTGVIERHEKRQAAEKTTGITEKPLTISPAYAIIAADATSS